MTASMILTRPSKRDAKSAGAPAIKVEWPALPIALVTPLGGVVTQHPEPNVPAVGRTVKVKASCLQATDHASSHAAALVSVKIHAALPDLLERVGPTTIDRLCDAVQSRIAALVERSLQSFRVRIGQIAKGLEIEQRIQLQDRAMLLRPEMEVLVGHMAASLSASETLGLLALSVDPVIGPQQASIDRLSAPSREAALDLARSDVEAISHPLFDAVVGGHLLDLLVTDPGLNSETREALRSHLIDRTAGPGSPTKGTSPAETLFLFAVSSGQNEVAIDVLAAATATPAAAIRKQVLLRNAKALVSLIWHAGYGADAATVAQIELCSIAPADILTTGSEAFPLSTNEMRWQCKTMLLADPVS